MRFRWRTGGVFTHRPVEERERSRDRDFGVFLQPDSDTRYGFSLLTERTSLPSLSPSSMLDVNLAPLSVSDPEAAFGGKNTRACAASGELPGSIARKDNRVSR
jgi:hypothetical protein